jgi:hypothetical protein
VRRLKGGVAELRERDGYAVGRGGATLGRDGGLILGVAHDDEGGALRVSQSEFEELVVVALFVKRSVVEARRAESRSSGLSVGLSVTRSVSWSPLVAREPTAQAPLLYFCVKKKRHQSVTVTVTSQPVTPCPRICHPLASPAILHTEGFQSAFASPQLSPAVLPTPTSPTSIPYLQSPPPFPVPVTLPAVHPNSARPHCRFLGLMKPPFAGLLQTTAAAESEDRSSPRPASRRMAVNLLVLPRPR